ncbi:phosphatase PAP2 family protein [Nocardioides guangzhouensis]|uniref:Phosphatase PAP2 family protein n=1 Tax=Nocardioides guangzhouensis TaxID=2497878 RepID=A0A4V1Y055_9ACTN|nr:phosphatase PAP2 family protein [Nocardioides guangzhouensis]RYP89069.1 phosphatase PAP2 family protein [Nocardioides guangzhouensis]
MGRPRATSTEERLQASAPASVRVRGPEEDAPTRREATRLTVTLWVVTALFAAVTLIRSVALDIPLRDPEGKMFRNRLGAAVVLLVLLALADALVRAWRSRTPGGRGLGHGVLRALQGRWTTRRTFLVASGVLAYHVVYVCYRNLKSWNAFNGERDGQLLDLDKALFLGHSPAELLHDLFGQGDAAVFFSVVYRSFTYLIPLSVVGTLAVLRVRNSYVMLWSGIWVWILGVASYYLVPSVGPFAAAPAEFAGLRPTAITDTQLEYVTERNHLLATPASPDAFASIGAFASLHVAFTCVILLVSAYYRWRVLTAVLAVYLVGVILSTVYFGWHFVADDIAGVVIAVLSVLLALLIVNGPRLWRDEPAAEPGSAP